MYYIINYGRGPCFVLLPHPPIIKNAIGPYFTAKEAWQILDFWTK